MPGTDRLELEEQIAVRLPRETHEELKRQAAADERTVAQTVRLAIRQYLAAAH